MMPKEKHPRESIYLGGFFNNVQDNGIEHKPGDNIQKIGLIPLLSSVRHCKYLAGNN